MILEIIMVGSFAAIAGLCFAASRFECWHVDHVRNAKGPAWCEYQRRKCRKCEDVRYFFKVKGSWQKVTYTPMPWSHGYEQGVCVEGQHCECWWACTSCCYCEMLQECPCD